jgi:hypothetical protein
MLNHTGARTENPAGAGRLYVNSWALSGKGGGNYLKPALLDIQCSKAEFKQATTVINKKGDPKSVGGFGKKIKHIRENHRGKELAKYVYALLDSSQKRLGSMIREPNEWLMTAFPNLDSYYLNRIIRWVEILIRDRKTVARKRYEIDLTKGSHIHLKREKGDVNWDYLTEDKIINHSVIVYAPEHESGKTSVGFKRALARIYGTKTNLYITLLRSLTRDAARKLQAYHYEDHYQEITNFQYLEKPLVTCFPSIFSDRVKAHSDEIGALCVDEIDQVLSCFESDKIFEKYKKADVLEQLKRLIIKAEQIYIADADVTEKTIQWVCDIRGIKRAQVLVVTGDKKKKKYKTTVEYAASKNRIGEYEKKVIEDLKAGHKLAIAVSTADDGRRILDAVRQALPDLKGDLFARAIGANEKDIDKLLADPSEFTKQYDYIIYTSLMNTGVSIEHDTPHFTKCYGIFNNITLSPNSCIQGLRRVR